MNTNTKSNAPRWSVTASIAVLTALIVVLSSWREWSYFWVIGMDFIPLLSPSDIASGVVRWLPVMVLYSMIVIAIGALMTYAVASASKRISSLGRWVSLLSVSGIGYAIAGMMVIYTLVRIVFTVGSPTEADWVHFLLIFVMAFSAWLSNTPLARSKLSEVVRLAVLLIPFLFYALFVSAFLEAANDLLQTSGEYRIVHTTGEVEDNVQLLRITSNGILILRTQFREISFITYSSFDRIDRLASSRYREIRKDPVPPADSTRAP